MAFTSNEELLLKEQILSALQETSITTAIDNVTRSTGLGSMSDAYQQMLGGINHRGLGNPVNLNRDTVGIVLMTRPYLNLTYDNVTLCRLLMPLLANDEKGSFTLQRYIRTLLDPRSHRGVGTGVTKLDSPLLSPKQPFMPLYTNNLLSVSGWPDITVDTFTSKEGVIKEAWSMIDGVAHIANRFNLTLNFRNVEGDPITAATFAWLLYSTLVRRGKMYPYSDSVINNRMDYCTRIYHLILDPSKRFVTKIAATGASFPTTVPIASAFNYAGEGTYTTSNEQLSFNFACIGADYNDPITISEFNRMSGIYDPDMRIVHASANHFQVAGEASGAVIRLLPSEMLKANYRGVPIIHPMTNELYWYVEADQYNMINE